MQVQSTPPPSAYHDPREVLCKHLIAQAYWSCLKLLQAEGIALADFDAPRRRFLDTFNSQHDIDVVSRCAAHAAAELLRAPQLSQRDAVRRLKKQLASARRELRRVLGALPELEQVDGGPSYVRDGVVLIAGQPAQGFAANPDFIQATLELIDEQGADAARCARAARLRGFELDADTLSLVRHAVAQRHGATDLLVDVLMKEQHSGRYASLAEFDHRPGQSDAGNRVTRLALIDQAYFLLGRLMSCIALTRPGSDPSLVRGAPDSCPIALTLMQAGVAASPARARAFTRFLLVRCSHGLSPGEFTARIAASVRTTCPRP